MPRRYNFRPSTLEQRSQRASRNHTPQEQSGFCTPVRPTIPGEQNAHAPSKPRQNPGTTNHLSPSNLMRIINRDADMTPQPIRHENREENGLSGPRSLFQPR